MCGNTEFTGALQLVLIQWFSEGGIHGSAVLFEIFDSGYNCSRRWDKR